MTVKEQRQRPSLGVVAISYNEEQNMSGFLDNLLPWVDEIVVVDDGSTDSTVSLLQAAGSKVKVIQRERQQKHDYAEKRNTGIAAAQSDWLLHMDIDERVSPELAREILQAIRDSGKDGYKFRRLNYFMHRPMRAGGWQHWNQIHLARREKFCFEGQVHERAKLDASDDRVGQLQGKMWHLNEPNYYVRMQKSERYSLLEVEKFKARGFRAHWYHILFGPVYYFLKGYVLKRGFMDGVPGLILHMHTGMAAFRVYALLWDEQHRIAREQLESEFRAAWSKQSAEMQNSANSVPLNGEALSSSGLGTSSSD